MMNAVCDDFGIGFRSEGVAHAFQIGAQCLVILDDPVVHDRDAVPRYLRVSVLHSRDAMSRPSGMRNAHVAADRSRVERFLKNLHLTDGSQAGDPAAVEHGDAGRIVAAVLQATQSLHEDRDRVAFRNDTYDSTHAGLFPSAKKSCLMCPTRKFSILRSSRPLLYIYFYDLLTTPHRYYRITGQGRRVIEEWTAIWAGTRSFVDRFIEKA